MCFAYDSGIIMKTTDTLTLKILNNDNLASGKHGTALFAIDGGTIGNTDDNHWSIQSQTQSVEQVHANIEMIDGYFCISAYAPNILLNDIDLFNKNKPIRLQHNDLLVIGDLNIKVRINDNGIPRPDPLAISPENIISNYQNPLSEILNKEKADFSEPSLTNKVEAPLISPLPVDPLKVLDSEKSSAIYNTSPETSVFDSPTDNILEQSIKLNPLTGHFFNDENRLTNVAIQPLYQGLRTTLPLNNSQEAYDVLEEIGHSIKAIIDGLCDLHNNHLHLANKQLTPTEDNPLYLNLDYQETLNLLYSTDKCPVHLCAPSAITESLNHIKFHHQANKIAISKALSALLEAFAPVALKQRFIRYRRHYEKGNTDSEWAWNMYSSYYNELISKRQQGFDKLFWEIYEQAYDQNIRRLKKEQDQKEQ